MLVRVNEAACVMIRDDIQSVYSTILYVYHLPVSFIPAKDS